MLLQNRKAIALAIGIAIGGATLVGCSGSEERQAKYLERAQQYFDKGDFDKARIETKNVLQINSTSAEAGGARYLLAQLAERERNYQQMFGELNAALEVNPKLIKARVKLAELFFGANQADKSNEEIDKILLQEPKNPDAFAIRAMILLRQQKTAEATVQAEKALELQPGNITATAALANIYGDTDPAKAEQILADSIKINPDDVGLRLIQIQTFKKHNKTDEAIAAFKQLIAKQPETLALSGDLANYYIELQRVDDAEALFRSTVEQLPKNDDAKLRLIQFLGIKRSPEVAVTQLEQYVAATLENYKLRSALARIYLGTKAPEKAIVTYQYTIDKSGHNAEGIDARNRVIEILLAQKKRPEAETLMKEILKLEPENADALFIRAQLALNDNDANSAIADLRSILKNAPESVPALSLMGAAQERIGASNLALDNYKKLIQLNGDNVLALSNAARLELAQNQIDEAQKFLEHAHKLAPDNIDVSRSLVDVYARKKMSKEALAICEELQLNSKTASAGLYLAGAVRLQSQEYPAAIELFKKALAKEPRAIEPLQALMTAYFANKQSDVATAYLEKHVKTYPEQAHAQELLGELYLRTNKLPQAQQLLEELLKKQPARISTYRELAQVYLAQSSSDKSANDKVGALFARGLEQNPDNLDLLVLQAQYYQSTGKDQQALDNYNKLLQLQPHAAVIKNNLATLLIEKFASEENLRRAQSLTSEFTDSNNPYFIDTLGWLQYKLKNYPQAVSLLESAVKKGGNFPELHYHLGMAYLSNNMADKAKPELTKATADKAQFPGRVEAEAALSKL